MKGDNLSRKVTPEVISKLQEIVGIANGIAGVLGGDGENGESPLVGVVSSLVGKVVSKAAAAHAGTAGASDSAAETAAEGTAESEDQKSE